MKKVFSCMILLTSLFFYLIPIIKNQMDEYVSQSNGELQIFFRIFVSIMISICITTVSIIFAGIMISKIEIPQPDNKQENQ